VDGILSFDNLLELSTARSSLENRGSLCLRLEVQEYISRQDALKRSNDEDYVSQVEIIKMWMQFSNPPWGRIPRGTNRYFIREPFPPVLDQSIAQDIIDDPKKSVRILARASEPQEGGNAPMNIHAKGDLASGEEIDLQTTREVALGSGQINHDVQANEKTGVAASDAKQNTPPEPVTDTLGVTTDNAFGVISGAEPLLDSLPIVAASEANSEKGSKAGIKSSDSQEKSLKVLAPEENISASPKPHLVEKEPSSLPLGFGQTAATTKQDIHSPPLDAVVPKKGVYVWISWDGISQVISINGLGPNDELIGLKEVDNIHHIMDQLKDLGETIQLNKRILENNTLKHAFAAHLELENSYKPPKFEYQAKVLYMAIFSFISLPPLKKFMRKLDFLGDWVATRRPQSSYPPKY
jgi:hypothetical protein